MSVARRLYHLLEPRERLGAVLLLGIMIPSAIMDTMGVASILPFMQLVVDPQAVTRGGFLSAAYQRLGFPSIEAALFAAGLLLFAVVALSNVLNALTIWLVQRFAWGLSHRLSTDVLSRYLGQPYSFFLGKNTASLNQKLLAEVNHVVGGVVTPVLQGSVRAITALLLLVLLAVVDWQLALTVMLVFGSAYTLVYAFVRRSQYRLGLERFEQNQLRYRIAQEALAGIKDAKTLGREREFLSRFVDPSQRFADAAVWNNVVARVPRHALEIVGFGGILLVVLYLLRTQSTVGTVLPILSLYAFAGYRLMPALNEIFHSVVTVRFNTPALEALHEDLSSLAAAEWVDPGGRELTEEAATFEEAIELEQVGFKYPERDAPTLSRIDLRILPKQVVGLVGVTGSGKTTLVDLILGLLTPTEGTIRLDGRERGAHSEWAWRRLWGYVPQDVFVCDDSVTANIAFGIPASRVDQGAVERAARLAQVHETVSALPEGYATVVGERGVRLSGGERQRIGIARALYHDPQILVMDEATNALDNVTESAVMDTVQQLMRKKTIVVIAHRLSTVRSCDVIHLLGGGTILASGTYDRLREESAQFRAIAMASERGSPEAE